MSNLAVVYDVCEKDVWDFQAKSGTSYSCLFGEQKRHE